MHKTIESPSASGNTIHSKVLQESRPLLIYAPPAALSGLKNGIRYPVIYLLDGKAFFHSFTGLVEYLSNTDNMPEMIVVGIPNTDRTRDLTPTHSVQWSDGEKDESALGRSGGGEKFLSFIQHELIPHIEATYPTAPYRMFVGHSLGGLTVLNALINHPAMFNAYVAIDPSVWWDNRSLIQKANEVLARGDYSGKQLFYASANTMDKKMDTIRVIKDTAHANVHVRDNLLFRAILKKHKASRLTWQWKYYPADNHPSVPLIAEYDALRFLFKGYEFHKDWNDPTLVAADLSVHYQKVSKQLGYEISPPEGTVNNLGYGIMEEKHYDRAYGFFRLNADNYPQSFNVHDSLGDYYLAVGDKKNAIAAFARALSLKEQPATRQKLDALQRDIGK
jgi:predicted alpha/beta superfamily hydrolase